MQINLFVDMDGVLAKYDENVSSLMYNKNFFLDLPKNDSMLKAVKELSGNKNINIFILTSVIDSPFCIEEKGLWLDKHLPEIKKENRMYVPYGTVKSSFVKSKIKIEGFKNILIDDYTKNLTKWNLPGALPIKAMNGINGTNGTWINSGGKYINIAENNSDVIKENIELLAQIQMM